MNQINSKTKLLGLIGNPVEHSYSPQIHNYISQKHEVNYVYTSMCVAPENLQDAIHGVRALGFMGINVTAPYKVAVMEYLDEISEFAKKYGSVNTIKNDGGRLIGYSTDADGFYRSIMDKDFDIAGKDVLIIGAGGAARPVCVKFALMGAGSISILNRTRTNTLKLYSLVEDCCGYKIDPDPSKARYDLIVNTTSVGMHPHIGSSPIDDYSFIDQYSVVADMIYNPSETLFLSQARKKGARTVNGMGMLIYQGLYAYEIFTGIKLDFNIYQEIANNILKTSEVEKGGLAKP